MEIDVVTACAYYPAHKRDGEQARWDTTKFCLAVKSREVKGYLNLKSGARVDASNISKPRKMFGAFIEKETSALKLNDYFYVPVPSKDSFDNASFRTYNMLCEALSPVERSKIIPALLFNQKVEPASKQGPRGYFNMRPLIKPVIHLEGRNIILVDDIVTTGGTMLACKAIIEENGGKVVKAIACGRTDDTEPHPWSHKTVRFMAQDDLF